MNDYVIRKGTKEDMPAVMLMIQELADFEGESDAVEVNVADLIAAGFSENPKFEVFVAELKNEIVGIALYYYRYSTWKGPTIHLEDLIVKKDKRGFGIGRALFNRVMKFAFDEKVRRVEWEVLDWNTNAIEFYEKSGAEILKGWQVVKMTESNLKTYIDKIT